MKVKNSIEDNIILELSLSESVGKFTNALVDTPQFSNFEKANDLFQSDMNARKALEEYQALVKELQSKRLFNKTSQAERDDLNRLWVAFQSFPSVSNYFKAQQEFQALCRACAQIISENCGLDFASSCGASCCG